MRKSKTRENADLIGCPDRIQQIGNATAFRKCLTERVSRWCDEYDFDKHVNLVGNVTERNSSLGNVLDITWIPENPRSSKEAAIRNAMPQLIAECAELKAFPLEVSDTGIAHLSLASELDHDTVMRAITGQYVVLAVNYTS